MANNTSNYDMPLPEGSDFYSINVVNEVTQTTDQILGQHASELQTLSSSLSALTETVSGKVDQITGKGLSANDFTDALRDKLEGVATGANKTVVDDALSTDSINPVQNDVLTREFAKYLPLTGGAVTGNIILPNSTRALMAYDSNGVAKNLIYLSVNDAVIINGNNTGQTRILSGLYVDGATSIGGALSTDGNLTAGRNLYINNCSGWNSGTPGGFFDETGQVCVVGSDSSHLPRINFVTNKKTTSAGYTQLRVNNTSSTNYVLTLPNSTGTIATSSSDIRLKENIRPTEVSGLELIEKIRLKQFDWREEGREGSPHWHVGMIADELEELDGNLTFGGGMNDDGTMNVKGVDSFYLLGYVIKAVQELSAEVERLKGGGKND